MIGAAFNKVKAEYFLDCLAKKQGDVARPEEGWTVDNLILLAGAALAVVYKEGPRLEGAHGVTLEHLEERREAIESGVMQNAMLAIEPGAIPNTMLAIEWMAIRCGQVINGEHDGVSEAGT